MVDTMTVSRADRAANLERWADDVAPDVLREVDTSALRRIAELADRRDHVEAELTTAVREARASSKSWSEIGAMLGVSKQAAQRKYSHKLSA